MLVLQVPDDNGGVQGAGGDQLAVGAESHAVDPGVVEAPLGFDGLRPVARVVHLHLQLRGPILIKYFCSVKRASMIIQKKLAVPSVQVY